MHSEVFVWVKESISWWGGDVSDNTSILEFGSLDMNGSIRTILQLPGTQYVGIDQQYGNGVDIVADASLFRTDQLFDIVVCCEVFEHTNKWQQIVANARLNLKAGGLFIATMAGEGRHPHSGIDGMGLRPGEHYENISAVDLEEELKQFSKYEVNVVNADTRGRAVR